MSITNIKNDVKSKYISHIILEGVDGVGKSTIVKLLFNELGHRYMVYDRGEMSNYVYAKKYNRQFVTIQRGLPILFILLVADKTVLQKRLIGRNDFEDLKKINEQDWFVSAAKEMKQDYHIIIHDTSRENPLETVKNLTKEIESAVFRINMSNISPINEMSPYNIMYLRGLSICGIYATLTQIDRQPFINNYPIASDLSYYNGAYETYTDHKTCPISLIYSTVYNPNSADSISKTHDFCYIIGSKIKRRPEVNEYISAFSKAKKKILKNKNWKKVYCDEYLQRIASSKATIYTARDVAYLKCLNARFYEGILAKQIVFVDKITDKDCELLPQIHKNKKIINLLYVTPKTIIKNYNYIITHKQLWAKIIKNQQNWYEKTRKEIMQWKK